VTNPAVQRLREAGIPLTAGEVLGGGWKKAQDAMTSVFGPGNMVARRYNEGRRALNQTAFNAAGEPIGAPVNAVGQQGVDLLNAAKNRAYSEALDPVTVNLNTPDFVRDITAATNAARSIPNVDQASDLAESAIENYIARPTFSTGGVLSGRDFQAGYRGLSKAASQAAPRIYGHEIGDALGTAKGALTDALQAQNPEAYEGFLKANQSNRNLNVLANALKAAQNQVSDEGEQLFTPAQLGSAATANAQKYGSNIGAASGNRPFNQLALDAQQVMSSKLPDSGTATRALVTGAVLGGTGGLGYAADGTEGAAIPAAALTLLGTRRGQQFLTAALANRTPRFIRIGNTLVRNPQYAGDLATSIAVPAVTRANQ
jgi:hypothetical protein